MNENTFPKSARQSPVESLTSATSANLDARVGMCLRCWSITGSEGVEVRVCSGTVVLHGEVTTSAAKYQVAECCRHIPGVRDVVDALSVVRSR